MSLVAIARRLPQDLQLPMLEFAEALEEDLRAQLAVRREDFEALQAAFRELAESHRRAEQRLDRLETVVAELAEAQKRTEQRVEELAEAQKRTEQRVEELAEAQKRTEQRVEELAEAQKRTEQRVEELAEAQKRTEQRVEELAEAQKRTEQRVDRLEKIVAELAEAQKRTEQRLEELTEAQKRTEERVDQLEKVVAELAEAQKHTEETLRKLIMRVDRIEVKLSRLVGDNLERKYRERPYSFLGQVLRPVHYVSLQDVLPQLEARLTDAEVDELLPLDVLLRGQVRQLPTRPEIWLAMEVSAVVDESDVERATDRARLLTKAGLRTMPAVAGEEITEGAKLLAARQKVLLLQDGRRYNWPDALEELLTADVR